MFSSGADGGAKDGAGLYYSKVYDFWSAVVQPDAVSVDQTGKKLTFKDGVTQWGWKRDVRHLYVRDCYTSTVQTLIDEVDMAMLDGTPGIGKSLFIFYYIYMIVNLAKEKGEPVPTFVISDRDGTEYFLGIDSNGNGIVRQPTTETPDYLITDTKGRANPYFIKQYLHVSSINNVNVKYVRKLLEQGDPKSKKERHTIYLPGFSWEEYFEVDGSDGSNLVSTHLHPFFVHLSDFDATTGSHEVLL